MPPASRKIGLHAFHEFLLGIFSGPVCGGKYGNARCLRKHIYHGAISKLKKEQKTSPQKNTASRNVEKFSGIFYPEVFFFLRKNDPVNLLLLASWGFLLPRDSKNRTTIGILSPGSRSTTSAIANRRHQLRRTSLVDEKTLICPKWIGFLFWVKQAANFLGEAQRIGENKYTQKSDSR